MSTEEKVRIKDIKAWLMRYVGQVAAESRGFYAAAFRELADEIEAKS